MSIGLRTQRCVLDRRQRRPRGRDERPVRLILGAGGDPAPERSPSGGGQLLVASSAAASACCGSSLKMRLDQLRCRPACRERWRRPSMASSRTVEPQVGLAGGAVGPVAGEAVLGQDRPDVAVVLRPRGLNGRNDHKDTKNTEETKSIAGVRFMMVPFRSSVFFVSLWCVSVRHGAAPVAAAGADVPGHRAGPPYADRRPAAPRRSPGVRALPRLGGDSRCGPRRVPRPRRGRRGTAVFSRPISLARKALPHDSAIRSCSRLSTARA